MVICKPYTAVMHGTWIVTKKKRKIKEKKRHLYLGIRTQSTDNIKDERELLD